MRILVIEDEAYVAQSLRLLLSQQGYGVDTALDGAQALDLLEAFEYDLLIVDLLLPDTDGVSLCQRLRGQGCLVPLLLLLTGEDSVEQKAFALNAGVDDYVVKSVDSRELLARIQVLLRRGLVLPETLLSWSDLRLNPGSRQVTYGDQEIGLTPKEYALLEMLLRHSNRTFSAKRLLDRVWAAEDYPGEETVRTHIKGLRQKLRQAGAPADFIETIHRVGYRLNPVFNSQAVVLPQATDIIAVAPAAEQTHLRQTLNGDSTLHLVALAQYDDVLPRLATHSPGLALFSYDLDPTASLILCRRLHQSEHWQHLPVIFLITQKTISVIRQVFDAGACDVVEQPVVGPELRTRIANQIRLVDQPMGTVRGELGRG